MKITTIGIDLAKSVFQVHGVDTQGKAVFKKQIKRDQMVTFFTNLMPCLIGMEACGMWQRPFLGPQVTSVGPHRTVNGAAVRQTLRQDQQERHG